jgi:cell wall-associated NlpC family hydrolase
MSGKRMAFAMAAKGLVGARFRFRGRDPRAGLDCVGVVTAALETLGSPVPSIAAYAIRQRDFGLQLDGAAAAGFEDADGRPQAGDLLLFRTGPAQVHLGVVGPDGRLVHAHAGLGKVVLTPPPLPWPVERHWRLRQD